jgi:tRNA1(Val) A37 N6-methylase TrmN6
VAFAEEAASSVTQERTSFRGWTIPGPRAPGGVELEEGESLDAISGHWRIFQLKKGHRFSTDDLVCAWYASQWAPRVDRYCDLGSGIGSVALMVAWRRPGCSVVTLEAQEISLRLQRKSIRYNGVDGRFTSLQGDLRDATCLEGEGPFDLVTGSPPYWATDAALPADKPQAFGARLEARGTVADYARAAARVLAPGGVFVCVFQAAHDERVRAGIADAGLALVRTRPIRFKAGVEAATSGARVYLAARATDLPEAARARVVEEPPLTVRAADGSIDDEYAAVKMSIGFPP